MNPLPHEPWPGSGDEPHVPTTGGVDPPARAALFLWIVGGLQAVFFTSCAACMGIAALLPADQWQEVLAQQNQSLPQGVTPSQFQGAMLPLAVLMFVLGVLPGIAYIVLAFFVRKAKPGAINLALLILITQMVVLGVMFLLNVGTGIVAGAPIQITVTVLTQGSLLAILFATARWLFKARSYGTEVIGQESDPWSEGDPW